MIRFRTLARAGLLAGAVVALTACSGGSAASLTPPPGADVTIDARDNAFDTNRIVTPAGTAFELYFRNLDGVPAASATIPPPSEPDVARMVSAAEGYETEIVGPPLT